MTYPRQRSAGPEIARDARAVDCAWTTLRDHLLGLRREIQDEIRNYPTPIAGCDQQFNYLLEKKHRIAAELSGIDQALARGDIARAIEIVRASEHIDQDVKASLTDARGG